jgi:4-O-beta-D-mannosyl-D-glucose phosphorylase
MDDDGTVFIYYASSDTRMHVAASTIDQLLDYMMNTPADGFGSAQTVRSVVELIDKNQANNIENSVLADSINKRAQ